MYKYIGATAVAVTAATMAYAALPLASPAERVEWDWTEDATRSHYNHALELPWAATLGTWKDAAGTIQGTIAFAAVPVVDRASEQVVQWDVTSLVQSGEADMLIRRAGGTNIKFHSREAADPAKRPRLVVWKDGEVVRYAPTADTTLNSTTVSSLGKGTTLATSGAFLIKFGVGPDRGIDRAVLEMTTTTEQYGNQTLSVFRAYPGPKMYAMPPFIRGTSDDIVMRLSGDAWRHPSFNYFRSDRMQIGADGRVTITIPTGSDTGSEAVFSIPKSARRTTMYARAIMKVHGDWTGTMGGKYPGLANTGQGDRRASNVCGWGSRVADGVCWSARTNRHRYVADNPFTKGYQALAPYAYRFNRSTYNGEGPDSSRPVPKGRFFVLDQMIKLNSIRSDGTPNADGLVAYWVNGVLVNHMKNVIWRTREGDDTLPSEYWLDVYEGGTGYKAPHPMSVTFAEVSISTRLLPYDSTRLAALNTAAVGP